MNVRPVRYNRAMTRAICIAIVLTLLQGSASANWPRPALGATQSGDPEVLFTFDDGPHHRWTRSILDTLAEHGVQGVFFWVGRRIERAERDRVRRELVVRAFAEGHIIGNHTVEHVHLCQSSEQDGGEQIDRNAKLLGDLLGVPTVLFRAPYGDHCDRVVKLLTERGLRHMHWDIDPREYLGRSAEDTASYVIGHLRRLRGRAVVLMHDTQPASARALPIILDWIAEENQRREERGARPIRILSASDVMAEQHPLPLWDWSFAFARHGRDELSAAVQALIPGALLPRSASLR